MSPPKEPIKPAGMDKFKQPPPNHDDDEDQNMEIFGEEEEGVVEDDFDKAYEDERDTHHYEPHPLVQPKPIELHQKLQNIPPIESKPLFQPLPPSLAGREAPISSINNPAPNKPAALANPQVAPSFQQKPQVLPLTTMQPPIKDTRLQPLPSNNPNLFSGPPLSQPRLNQPTSGATHPITLHDNLHPTGTKGYLCSDLGFESDEQFQNYLTSLTEYDRSRYHQLLQKNRELKEELKKIASQTEDLIRKEKDKRRAKPHVEENEEIQSKMRILKQQQFHISNLKAKIAQKRAELDETHQYGQVREKEDELKDLKRRLKELLEERETVSAVKKEQEKALASLTGNDDQEARKKQLLQELHEIKAENKVLVEKKQELEKELKKNHSKMFDGKIYIRELQRRIEQHKKRFPGDDLRGISEDDVERMKSKIRELEEERKEKISTHDRDMRDVDQMRKELEKEHDRLQRVLAEKDREMRTNSLKLKELKRIQRARAQKPLKSR